MRRGLRSLLAAAAGPLVFGARAAFGQEVGEIAEAAGAEAAASGLDSGDVAWILTSSAIVLMMTIPGLALFYGGLVRAKNVLSIVMLCFVTAALVSVTWVLWGYSVAFGPSVSGLFGDPSAFFGLRDVSWEAGPDESIPPQLFMVFQLMFAIITPALIVGAIAERMKFAAFFLFVLLWSTLIYSPLAHWVWGGGLLASEVSPAPLDFAGGTVVHISSGVSALIAASMIGRRRGYGHDPMPPHNVPFVVVGAALLWVGWFGFNAGSALAADGIATVAFVNTNTATGAAVLGWMFSEWIGKGAPTAVGAATGAVAGLVAITPAAGFVEPWASILIGVVAGFLCYKAVNWKHRVGYDDALDVVGVHGVGGTWGALATGLFASAALTDGAGGWFTTGNGAQLVSQAVGIIATYALCAAGTFLILGLINSVVGLRVEDEDEETGLDLTLHAESAYASASGGGATIGERAPRRERERPSYAPAPPAPRTPRQPPSAPILRREPPRLPTQTIGGSGGAAEGPAGPPAATPVPASGAVSSGSGPFRIVVDGIDQRALTRWWRDLCTQDHTKAPQAFRDIYPNVRSFEGTTFHFRGGDPSSTRERLVNLLDMYGAHAGDVRVEA